MNCEEPFDLSEFMFTRFNGLDLGGDLFGQWPVGIRFEIGIKRVDRAVELFRFTFAETQNCIMVSQDWLDGQEIAESSSKLFETPSVFQAPPINFQTLGVYPFDESAYQLAWARLSPRDLNAVQIWDGIANREQDRNPKISSAVYVIDPQSEIIMHMYDDRGLDVIAKSLETLRPMYDRYRRWILEHERSKIDVRFKYRNQPEEV